MAEQCPADASKEETDSPSWPLEHEQSAKTSNPEGEIVVGADGVAEDGVPEGGCQQTDDGCLDTTQTVGNSRMLLEPVPPRLDADDEEPAG